ncbi:MAG: hypothetical protein K1X83_12900 [Oligoflexia bacterium]|nr:hypothetical protein [Oligoflexia bacterium]
MFKGIVRRAGPAFRLLAILLCAAFLVLTLADLIHPSLQYQSGSVESMDLPLANHSLLMDSITRAPIALLSLIPEQYQVEAGLIAFLPLFAKKLPSETKVQIKNSVRELYGAMRRDTEWNRLPSVTGYAALDLLGISPQRAHAYLYLPRSAQGHPKGAVLFLHGSLGNLKAYPYLWAEYAEKTQSLIICPSFGFGRWSNEQDSIETVLNALPEELRVPRSKTVIAGLSAGGIGVMRELQRHSDYQAAVFISAVLPDSATTAGLAAAWQHKLFLLFNGTEDFLVTEQYAVQKTRDYSSFGAALDLFPKENHFLFMSQAPKIFERLELALAPLTNHGGRTD